MYSPGGASTDLAAEWAGQGVWAAGSQREAGTDRPTRQTHRGPRHRQGLAQKLFP